MTHPLAKENCVVCSGTGKIQIPTKNAPPKERLCACTIEGNINRKLEYAWKGLSKGSPIKDCPLVEFVKKNLWVTAETGWLRNHLRHVAVRQPLSWRFKIITDKELIAAWLATAALAGVDIFDKEAFEIMASKFSIEDLVQPYDLVVLRLGVKMARNSALPEVLMEALSLREHLDLPTWVWDQPTKPLGEGHRCFSMEVFSELQRWDRINGYRRSNISRKKEITPNRARGVRTLSQERSKK